MKIRNVTTEPELRALGSDIRLAILRVMAWDVHKEWYAWEIADVVRVPQINIYYHLKRLVDVGFLVQTLDRVVNGIEEKTYRAAYGEIRFQVVGKPAARVRRGRKVDRVPVQG